MTSVATRQGSDPEAASIRVERIDNVTPLGKAAGVWPRVFCPPALAGALFAADGPPCHAILDAGVIRGLPEHLEGSGLPFHCLYKGDLADQLRAVAPYLVRLEPEHPLTAALMTDDGSPKGWWPLDYGFFVTSRSDTAALLTHFRKFTSVTSASTGKRSYLRFWGAATLMALARHGLSDPLTLRLVAGHRLFVRDLSPLAPPGVLILSAEGER